MFGKIEKEEEAAKQEAVARRSANAPAPGAKPAKARRGSALGAADAESDVGTAAETNGTGGVTSATNGAAPANRAPRPGSRPAARPKKRKR